MKFNVIKSVFVYDNADGHYERFSEEKEGVLVHSHGHHYSDAVDVYYLDGCAEEEAERICEEINSKRVHQFSDYAEAQKVPYGMMVVVTHPYDD